MTLVVHDWVAGHAQESLNGLDDESAHSRLSVTVGTYQNDLGKVDVR